MKPERTPPTRIRGRKGQELRKRRLAAEPLCRHCLEKGIITAAVTPDHIVPLSAGGTDTDDNIQCLCAECHAAKTASEAAQGFGAANHPDWLKPSAIPLTIVCGPPASGKTTYIADRAHAADMVIDIDTIARTIEPKYVHWTGLLQGALLDKAIRVRNEMLASLSRARSGKAWFIVSAPTQAERTWWQEKLGGQVVLLDPGASECKRRALHRGTPQAVNGIEEWYRKARSPWRPRSVKPQIGIDGWPIG